ncbi:YcdB/YcdC domain-containing protein [Paenibacillus sp. GP183]|uniref:YcdB/YcdC domain-containing protein n=1 Tax=Paenibacillus sp. GP183 TaxID=1882751 RepID=UPI0008992375|nr:YcdB/YcdC domain-containing protein [Paenibacillus sp. GP183]SEC24037.1 S-layer homology domain-containing protein [Paenibacillus sp. GP183]
MKLLKQAGTAVLASALLFSYVPQVLASDIAVTTSSPVMPGKDGAVTAEAKISKEKAIELAQTYITLPEGYTLQSVNLSTYPIYSGVATPTWNLSYTKKVKDQYLGNINITINGTNGKLTGYYFSNNDPDHKPSYPPKVNYQGAKEAAAQWIAKINPDEQKQLVYNQQNEQSFRTPLNGDFQYNIRYDRMVDGIPFPQNGVSISVNSEGVVTNYSYQWDESAAFEKVASPISMEKAVQAFRDKTKVFLIYQIPYGAKGEKKPIISYNMSTVFLNAATGEPWSPEGYDLPTQSDAKPLTDKPLGAKPAANLNLTKEQAIQKVQDTVKFPADAKLENASYNESTNPETGEKNSSWNLNWSQAPVDPTLSVSGKIPYSIYATVNSQTGELLNFNHYIPYKDGQNKEIVAKVSQETAKQQAIDYVKKNLPAYTDQLVLDDFTLNAIPLDQQKTMRNWDFNFQRIIDGVNAAGERVSVSIDKTTGEMVNYNFYFSNIAFPTQKPEVLPLDKAKDLLLSQYNIVLAYTPQNGNMGYGYGGISYQKMNVMIAAGEIPPGTNTDKKSAKLVYMLVPKYTQQGFFLDAVTGQWKDPSTGEVIILDKIKVSDIEGHWAQNELQLMVDYQALDVVNGQVNPNKVITRGEMIKMLVIAMNGGRGGINYGKERAASFADVINDSPLFAYVENAVDRGLVDRGTDLNPNATMNREGMAQLVVRALGYKNLTKYSTIFNDKFTDAAAIKNIGEVAIVVGLNIMTLSDGSFGSTEVVTRAQAATAFFRYLQKRAELQDGPRYF